MKIPGGGNPSTAYQSSSSAARPKDSTIIVNNSIIDNNSIIESPTAGGLSRQWARPAAAIATLAECRAFVNGGPARAAG